MNRSDETGTYCQRVTTNDITTRDTGSTFVGQSRSKEVLNPKEVLKMFEQDFAEGMKDKPVSLEDRKFLNVTKREIHVTNDGRYEMPLPFRDDKVDLPCNRKLAESRLDGLKSRFAKDPKYKDEYCKFIDDMQRKATRRRHHRNMERFGICHISECITHASPIRLESCSIVRLSMKANP